MSLGMCNDGDLYIHYGETINIGVTYEDITATAGTFYAGVSGEPPIISKPFTLANGIGTIELTDAETLIPLGDYNFSIVIDGAELPNGPVLPVIHITESVKNIEVTS